MGGQQETEYNALLDKKTSLNIQSLILNKKRYIALANQFHALDGYKDAAALADECESAINRVDADLRYYIKCIPAFFFLTVSVLAQLFSIILCPMMADEPASTTVYAYIFYLAITITPFAILFYAGSDRKKLRAAALCMFILSMFYFPGQLSGACNNTEGFALTVLIISLLPAYILAIFFPNSILKDEIERRFVNSKFLAAFSALVLVLLTVTAFVMVPQIDINAADYISTPAITEKTNIHYVFWHTSLMLICMYVYMKILNLKNVSKPVILSAVLTSFIFAFPFFRVPILNELLSPGLLFVFAAVTTRVKISILTAAVIISFGSYYSIEMLIRSVIAVLEFLAYNTHASIMFQIENVSPDVFRESYTPPILSENIALYLVRIPTIAFVYFFFNMQRLNTGLVFMQSKEARRTGVFFSILIIIIRIFWAYQGVESIPVIVFILIAINICAFGIHQWWQNHTTMQYQQRLKDRAIQEYKSEIEDKDMQIKNLTDSNEYLSKTVHRDNKLVPAMYNAVRSFMGGAVSIVNETEGKRILNELDEMMRERKEIIVRKQWEHKPIPSSEMWRIDTLLAYMYQRASENGIQFDVEIPANIKDITESVISKQRLETLLADMIENAIIAVSYGEYKKILVAMGAADDCLEINVQDSGIPFESGTLAELGLIKSTTHKDEGGSGIGYLTIFEILNESDASLIITEYVPENFAFTKSIKVRFDGRASYTLNSYR